MEVRRTRAAHGAVVLRVLLLLGTVLSLGCRTARTEVQPTPDLPVTGTAAADARPQPAPSEADARFLQMMLVHHAQALEMTALVSDRAQRQDIRMVAARIEAAQRDEMEMMERWLQDRGFATADPHAHHRGHGGHDMPGMLTPAELERLTAARGAEFDRLFLDYMIRHHEGALVMVEELLATPGAAQDSEIYQIATHVDADQRAEIARMRRMQQGTIDRGTE